MNLCQYVYYGSVKSCYLTTPSSGEGKNSNTLAYYAGMLRLGATPEWIWGAVWALVSVCSQQKR